MAGGRRYRALRPAPDHTLERTAPNGAIRLLLAATVIVWFLLFASWVGVARAVPQCDTSWVSASSGFWDVPGNWTGGVPGPNSSTCISVAGTYTVSVRGGSNVTRDLTLGGASGTQTLEVSGSAADGNATLALVDHRQPGDGVLVNGRVVLTTTDASAWSRIDVKNGRLWNAGEIDVEPGAGNLGGRYLYGDVTQRPGT